MYSKWPNLNLSLTRWRHIIISNRVVYEYNSIYFLKNCFLCTLQIVTFCYLKVYRISLQAPKFASACESSISERLDTLFLTRAF